MKRTAWTSLAASLFLCTGVHAADRFVGLGVGTADIDDTVNISGSQLTVNENATGWKFYGGMLITENFGFEAGWTDLGDMNDAGTDIETEGFVMAGLASLPLGKSFSVYAKAGVYLWDQDINTISYDGEDLMYGIGARLRFMDQFHVRLEWERFDTPLEADLISLTGGIQF